MNTQNIGRYQILKELGRGAMGVVYAATDPNIGRKVAIKTIRISDDGGTSNRQELRDRLRREAQAAGTLAHPGIVTIFDVVEEGDQAYIVMEFVDGKNMEDVLSSQTSQPGLTLIRVLVKTAEALDYAHGNGIVHRDLKPSNILVFSDGRIKIADFGIAKISSSPAMTQAGLVMGTPDYMSPEQAQGHTVDGRADQFSLAVIACRMLTGKLPFSGPTFTSVLAKILWEEPQYLNANLEPQIQAVLRKALAKDPSGRYATCLEFAEDLERNYLASRQQVINDGGVLSAVQPARSAETGGSKQWGMTNSDPKAEGLSESRTPSSMRMISPVNPSNVDGEETEATPYNESAGSQPQDPSPSKPQYAPPIDAPRMKRRFTLMAASIGIMGLLVVSLLFWRHSHRVSTLASVELSIQTAQAAAPQAAAPQIAAPEVPVTEAAPTATLDPPVQASDAPIAKAEAPKIPVSVTKKPTISKKAEPAARASVALQSAKLPEAIMQPAPLPLPVEPEIRALPSQKPVESGAITWTGRLNKNSVLVISDQQASVGTLSGKLPGIPVTVEIEPQTVLVRQAPSGDNSWKELILYSGSQKLTSLTIHWTAKRE